MKKAILSIVLVFILCFLCCGCDVIDEMRQMHAVYLEDRSIMLADGKIYKMLPDCDELTPNFYYGATTYVYVTEKDVPVLLSQIEGNSYAKSEDGIFLKGYDNATRKTKIYCREDTFERINEQINGDINYTQVGYWYYDIQGEENQYNARTYILREVQKRAFFAVMGTVEAQKLVQEILDYDYATDIYLFSNDEYFSRYIATIYLNNGKFYIVKELSDGAYFYVVPSDYSETFAEIMSKWVECERKMMPQTY